MSKAAVVSRSVAFVVRLYGRIVVKSAMEILSLIAFLLGSPIYVQRPPESSVSTQAAPAEPTVSASTQAAAVKP